MAANDDVSSLGPLAGRQVMHGLGEIDDLLQIEHMLAVAPPGGGFEPRDGRRLNVSEKGLAYLLELDDAHRRAFLQYVSRL